MNAIKEKENIELLSKYEPKSVFEYFAKLCNIPHGSGNEKQVSEFIAETLRPYCKEVKVYQDGTVYAYKEATPGYEDRKTVCLQGHMDMVCVKTKLSNHDFKKDPLDLYVEDGWIHARGTSLGGDNGIGSSYILDIFTNNKIEHGPIEALFTSAEETTMYGAAHLPTDVLKGDYMINLDHEDTYSLCIGCQGGSEFAVVNKFERVDVEGLSAQMTINIENGAGGHSGHMVRKKVINAINMMFEILALVSDKYKFAIISAEGGVARNVIAPMCKVEIAINPSDYEGIKKEFEKFFGDFKTEFTEREQKLSLDISQNELTQKPASLEYTQKIINAFNTVIMGVYALSETYPISEGSINWGEISTKGDSFESLFMLRSLYGERKQRILRKAISAFYGVEHEVTVTQDYPEWTPLNSGNFIEKKFDELCKEMTGHAPEIQVTEGGVETGVLLKKYPNMAAICIGPTILHAHSFDEKAEIEAVGVIYNILLELLKSIDKKD